MRSLRSLKITGIICATLVATVSWMAFDNTAPYAWEGGEVHPDPAPDGAQVSIHWKMRINRVCPGIIQRQIIDAREVIHNYDPVPAASGRDVTTEFWVTFKLPMGMPPGPSKYRVHATYYCNPLQFIWPLHVTTARNYIHAGPLACTHSCCSSPLRFKLQMQARRAHSL